MINLLLLFLGMFIDALALQFLVLPMLIPIAEQFGIDMIFFWSNDNIKHDDRNFNTANGYGSLCGCTSWKMPVSTVTKGVLPFIIPIFLTLVLITIFPQIITFIPNLIMP